MVDIKSEKTSERIEKQMEKKERKKAPEDRAVGREKRWELRDRTREIGFSILKSEIGGIRVLIQ